MSNLTLAQIESREKQLGEEGKTILARYQDCESKGNPEVLRKSVTKEMKDWQDKWDELARTRKQVVANKLRYAGGNAVGYDGEDIENKAVGRSPLPMDLPVTEWRGLWQAAVNRQPSYRLDTKHMNAQTKAAFSESGGANTFASGNFPPILMPQLTLDQPLEPDRVFDHIHIIPAPHARAVEYLQHTGNANVATNVPELGNIPDVGQQWTTVTQSFVKIGGIATYSLESIMDSFDIFMQFVPSELQRICIDAESNAAINGAGGANLLGILNTSGTLSRTVGSDTPLDSIRKSVNDIRTGTSFALADTIILNPQTAAALQLQKSTTGQYLVNPSDPEAHASLTDLFGLTVVANTYCPVGTGIVYDSRWIYGWIRQALSIDMQSHGTDSSGTNLWTQYATSFRVVERVATGIARPTAVNIITGLPS